MQYFRWVSADLGSQILGASVLWLTFRCTVLYCTALVRCTPHTLLILPHSPPPLPQEFDFSLYCTCAVYCTMYGLAALFFTHCCRYLFSLILFYFYPYSVAIFLFLSLCSALFKRFLFFLCSVLPLFCSSFIFLCRTNNRLYQVRCVSTVRSGNKWAGSGGVCYLFQERCSDDRHWSSFEDITGNERRRVENSSHCNDCEMHTEIVYKIIWWEIKLPCRHITKTHWK